MEKNQDSLSDGKFPMIDVNIPIFEKSKEPNPDLFPESGDSEEGDGELEEESNGHEPEGEEIKNEVKEVDDGEKEDNNDKKQQKKVKLPGVLRGDKVLISEGLELYEKNGFGDPIESGGIEICPEEALYLTEKKRITVSAKGDNEKELDFDSLLDKFKALYVDIYIRYQVFRDLRDRGLVVRSGLKYGTHFRVYERGVRPKKGVRAPWEHAKYLVHAISEGQTYTVPELARFVRLAHSVKKKLWLAIVDGEGDVTYYQIIRVTP